MRESEVYKKIQDNVRSGEEYLNRSHHCGFLQGYQHKHEVDKEYLEWQKPKDVELEHMKKYLAKTKENGDYYLVHYNANAKWFYCEDGYAFKKNDILIKKIEV